jgi:hypothetical protein
MHPTICHPKLEEFIENLDGSWPDDLRDYVNRINGVLLPVQYLQVRDDLADYASTKAAAMEERSSGNIPRALELEGKCERIYARLPEWARW